MSPVEYHSMCREQVSTTLSGPLPMTWPSTKCNDQGVPPQVPPSTTFGGVLVPVVVYLGPPVHPDPARGGGTGLALTVAWCLWIIAILWIMSDIKK